MRMLPLSEHASCKEAYNLDTPAQSSGYFTFFRPLITFSYTFDHLILFTHKYSKAWPSGKWI